MGGKTNPASPRQPPICAATLSVFCSTNSTRITGGQEKEGALWFLLTFSSASITWMFGWGVAMPVCRLPYLYATALSPEAWVVIQQFWLTWVPRRPSMNKNVPSIKYLLLPVWASPFHRAVLWPFGKSEHSFFFLQHGWLKSAMNYNSLLDTSCSCSFGKCNGPCS